MTETSWPAAPDEAVFHGPAGEFVLRTDPHTESHPMALLSQVLVAFGTATGNSVHYTVEASHHHSNEFIVLVGPSSKGRKGSSWDHVEALMRDVDEGFVERCIASGMSSGEGLIAEVADDSENTAGEKRRLIVESEFAQVMKVLAREGNTLSPGSAQRPDADRPAPSQRLGARRRLTQLCFRLGASARTRGGRAGQAGGRLSPLTSAPRVGPRSKIG